MEEARLARWGRGAAAVVLLFTVVDLLNVKTAPWTSLCLAVLGLAILVQSGHPNRPRVWLGRTLAVAVAAFGIVVLAEHFASKSFGPTPRTAASILYLSAGVLLMRIDRRRTGWLWGLSLLAALATPITTVVGHTFKAVAAVNMPESTGQGISTAVGVLLLVTATVMARPDRNPVAWLVKRPDRWALLRLVGILGGLAGTGPGRRRAQGFGPGAVRDVARQPVQGALQQVAVDLVAHAFGDVDGRITLQPGQPLDRLARVLGRNDRIGPAVQEMQRGQGRRHLGQGGIAAREGQHPAGQAVVHLHQLQGHDGALGEAEDRGGGRPHAQARLGLAQPLGQGRQGLGHPGRAVVFGHAGDGEPLPGAPGRVDIQRLETVRRDDGGLRESALQLGRQRGHALGAAAHAVQQHHQLGGVALGGQPLQRGVHVLIVHGVGRPGGTGGLGRPSAKRVQET